jgi:hypothetical protein
VSRMGGGRQGVSVPPGSCGENWSRCCRSVSRDSLTPRSTITILWSAARAGRSEVRRYRDWYIVGNLATSINVRVTDEVMAIQPSHQA